MAVAAIAVAGLAFGAVSSVVSMRRERRAARAAERAQEAQEQARQAEVRRMRRKEIRERRIEQARLRSMAEASGAGAGSSAFQGGATSLSSQSGYNLGFIGATDNAQSNAAKWNRRSNRYATQANTWAGISNLSSSIGSMALSYSQQ